MTKKKKLLLDSHGLPAGPLYLYQGTCISVYDGDTVTVVVDLGFSMRFELTCRLYGIDTPEIRGEERPDGLISKDFVKEKILGKRIWFKTYKDRTGKYGRYLAQIFYERGMGDWVNLNLELVELGLAEEYGG